MTDATSTSVPQVAAASTAQRILDDIYGKVLNGFGIFAPVEDLAREYLEDNDHNARRAAHDLVRWQTAKSATSGFVTNLGGVATLPISIPANISSVLYIQVRMIAAIAIMAGHDVASDKVRTLIFASLLGSAATDALKDVGIKFGEHLARSAVNKMSEAAVKKLAGGVATRLAGKIGLVGTTQLAKLVPIAGGIVGGAIDAASTKTIGAVAIKLFLPEDNQLIL